MSWHSWRPWEAVCTSRILPLSEKKTDMINSLVHGGVWKLDLQCDRAETLLIYNEDEWEAVVATPASPLNIALRKNSASSPLLRSYDPKKVVNLPKSTYQAC